MFNKDGKEYLKYVKARNKAKEKVRRAVRDYEKRSLKEAKKNPKASDKFVNKDKLKTSYRVTNILPEHDNLVSSDAGKAEVFNTYFSSVFTEEQSVNEKLDVRLQ